MTINDNLFVLYEKENILGLLDSYNKKNIDNDWTWPLLLKSYRDYETANIRIMIFGKETNGWGPYPEDIDQNGVDINCLMNVYERFFNEGNCKYNSSFFPVIDEFMKVLRDLFKEKSIHYLWNNVIKIGKGSKGFPEKMYNELIKDSISRIIPMEINILKPNYIIFFTGPNTYQSGPYDDIIDNIFENPQRKNVLNMKERELCEIIIPNTRKSFRLYHPNYLHLRKMREKIDYLDTFRIISSEMLNDL